MVLYLEHLGYDISGILWRQLGRRRSVPRNDMVEALTSLCLECGIVPPETDNLPSTLDMEDMKTVIDKCGLCYRVKETMAQQQQKHFPDLDQVKDFFESYAKDGVLKNVRENLGDCYLLMASIAIDPECDPQTLRRIASIQVQNAPKDEMTSEEFLGAFIAGPVSHFKFPPRWWCVENSQHVQVVKYGLLKGRSGAFVEYVWGEEGLHRTRRVRIQKGANVQEKVDAYTKHLLAPQLRADVVKMLMSGQDAQWTVEEEDEEYDTDDNQPGFDVLYRKGEKAIKDADLQHVPETLLKEYKQVMEERFQKAAVTPENPDYQYKVEKEFQPTRKSGWDSD